VLQIEASAADVLLNATPLPVLRCLAVNHGKTERVPTPVAVAPTRSKAPASSARASRPAVVQAKLVVGASDDPAEFQADAIADGVMQTISGGASPSPIGIGPVTRIRRMATASRAPAAEIGEAGGAVDAVTEREIGAARSGGQPLEGKIRRRMEDALGADFSGVRLHVGKKSDELNSRIQARAFTSGADIFIRREDHAPSTARGQRLLAHELAHTIQQGAATQHSEAQRSVASVAHSVQRSSAVIQRWDWWERRKEEKARAAAIEKEQKDQQRAKDKEAAANGPYQGKAAVKPNSTVEIAKPSVAMTATGATAGLSALSSADYSGPAGGAVLGPVLLADSAMGMYGAYGMNAEAAEHGDKGMAKMAGRKAKTMGTAMAGAAIGTTKAGVDIANVASGGAKLLGHTALGAGSGALGVATGSVQVLQGVWRGGQAMMKLCRLTWGRAAEMLTNKGDEWKRAALRAEKFKLAINGFKVALGALGIAAGALLIVSNPIGWAIGIAGAIAGGVYAISKIAAKVKNTKDLEKGGDIAKIRAGQKVEEVDPGPKSGLNIGKPRVKKGTGAAKPKEKDQDGNDVPDSKRKQAIDEANAVARIACENAATAGEMRDALSHGDLPTVQAAVDDYAKDDEFEVEKSLKAVDDKYLYDAFQILSSINVSYEEALSDSGQDLIQNKLSKAESM